MVRAGEGFDILCLLDFEIVYALFQKMISYFQTCIKTKKMSTTQYCEKLFFIHFKVFPKQYFVV